MLEYEKAPVRATQEEIAAGQVWVDTPHTRECGSVTVGLTVEVGGLLKHMVTLDLHDAQASTVVRHVDMAVVRVQVVIDRFGLMPVRVHHARALEVPHVKDVGLRDLVRTACLVQLVVCVGKLMVFIEPPLMSVLAASVARPGEHHWSSRICHINDGQRVFVVCKANLLAHERFVGTTVDHTLGVVRIAVCREAAQKDRVDGIADVHDV